jgi:hypothetical protein
MTVLPFYVSPPRRGGNADDSCSWFYVSGWHAFVGPRLPHHGAATRLQVLSFSDLHATMEWEKRWKKPHSALFTVCRPVAHGMFTARFPFTVRLPFGSPGCTVPYVRAKRRKEGTRTSERFVCLREGCMQGLERCRACDRATGGGRRLSVESMAQTTSLQYLGHDVPHAPRLCARSRSRSSRAHDSSPR